MIISSENAHIDSDEVTLLFDSLRNDVVYNSDREVTQVRQKQAAIMSKISESNHKPKSVIKLRKRGDSYNCRQIFGITKAVTVR